MRVSTRGFRRSVLDGQARLARCHPATLPLSLLCNLVLIASLLWRAGTAGQTRQQRLSDSSGGAGSSALGSTGGSAAAAGQLGGEAAAAVGGDVGSRLQQAEQLLTDMQAETGALHVALQSSKQALAAAQQQQQQPGIMSDTAATAAAALAGGTNGVHSGSGGGQRRYWMTIGIPTVPRSQVNTTYLTVTIQTLLDELPADPTDLLYGAVRVLVMNNAAPGQRHEEFERLRRRAVTDTGLFGRKARAYIDWLDNPGTVADPAPDLPEPDDLHNPTNKPGRQVRKQTCDVVTILRHAAPLSRYYMFMEDDFEVCQYMLRAVQYALAKANALPHLEGWVALRFSYGMNGVIIRNEDAPRLADFLWRHIALLPPDLLWLEWVLRQPSEPGAQPLGLDQRPLTITRRRPYVVYRYNLLSHLGAISSFAVRPDRPDWPRCLASMSTVWSLHTSERFQARCSHTTDLSPCPYRLRRSPPPPAAPTGSQQQAVQEKWLDALMVWPGVQEAVVRDAAAAAAAAAAKAGAAGASHHLGRGLLQHPPAPG